MAAPQLSNQPDDGSRYQHETDGDEVLALAVTMVTQDSALFRQDQSYPEMECDSPEEIQPSCRRFRGAALVQQLSH